MKRILITISLLIIISNMVLARERINQDPSAHVKPTNSTDIEAVEILPTVIHMSETEEIVMETMATQPETSEEEATIEETTIEETEVVIPEVEQAFVDNKVYKKDDMPIVGYSRKDEDEPTNAQIETIQDITTLFMPIPHSLGVRITYRSEVEGWAEFDITYKTNRGNYTNTIIKPIAKGLNILSVNSGQNENVVFFTSPSIYCSKITRIVFS